MGKINIDKEIEVTKMSNEFTPELITLIDDEGNEHSFEILDTIVVDDSEYYALYPFYENPEDSVNDAGEYYIMEAVLNDNGEEEFAEIEDEELLDKLAEQFEANFEKLFDDEEE